LEDEVTDELKTAANSFSGGQCSCTAENFRRIRRCALQNFRRKNLALRKNSSPTTGWSQWHG